MHFTVVFSGSEANDRSYGLAFIPSPCWVRGTEVLLNLNPHTPTLEPGSVRRLLDHEKLRGELAPNGLACTIVVHSSGHGTLRELNALQHELGAEGFSVRVVGPFAPGESPTT